MGFNSIPFLFAFLPIFLGLYYLTPKTYRNLLLTVGSIVFFAIGSWKAPWSIALLLGFTLLSWGSTLAMEKYAEQKKYILIGSIALLFATLMGFKIANLFGKSLPLAISFYTFQITALLVEVYRGNLPVEKNPISYATAVLMFPKLLSGPIMEPRMLSRQVESRRYRAYTFDQGVRTFILGLSMKVLLADRVGGLWREVQKIGYESISTPLAWMAIAAFSFQLYFDFCGYSWMAIGVGKMMGFHLPQNFDSPYASRSMRDFWRRWHITLGAWFRDYVYIPLGGSKNGMKKTIRNMLVVWLFTGIWHGNGLNFVLWGLFLFGLLVLERLYIGDFLEAHGWAGHLYMLLMIPLSWLIFAIPRLSDIGMYFSRMFPIFGTGIAINPKDFLTYGKQFGLLLVLCTLFSTPYPQKYREKINGSILETVILFALFWGCVYCISVSANDPFMYFQF